MHKINEKIKYINRSPSDTKTYINFNPNQNVNNKLKFPWGPWVVSRQHYNKQKPAVLVVCLLCMTVLAHTGLHIKKTQTIYLFSSLGHITPSTQTQACSTEMTGITAAK